VRQTARTSEGLLAKVKLLMIMVTAVVLISAGSSVAGTMSTTVLERGKEIGLMKAMGGTRWEVMLIFCGEAALLASWVGSPSFGSVIAQFITRTVFSASAEFIPGSPVSPGGNLSRFVGQYRPDDFRVQARSGVEACGR
jgi:putative ABC transport system permease protein